MFAQQHRNPQFLMPLGMLSLALALIVTRFAHPVTDFSRGFVDGFMGMLIGFSVALNVVALRIVAKQRRTGME